jgi:hypothetical protein
MSQKVLQEEAFKAIDAQSMGADIESEAISIEKLDNVGIELAFTGAPVGEFAVYGSNSKVNWGKLDITLDDGETVPSTADGSPILLGLPNLPYEWIKIKYIRTSGTGTLNCWVHAKGL